MQWDVKEAKKYARAGQLEAWIDSYLRQKDWQNIEMAEGLKKAPRIWEGPVLVSLKDIVRHCGPEETMDYKIRPDWWEHTITNMATGFSAPETLPPLILQRVDSVLHARDGNHRIAAAQLKGWEELWALVWMNT
ncbi:MAG: hypothetical protein GC136_04105 [Alphaproteobacteria bacterium]|nr:hypothetical protein [Alphaproteobacteria bacterium]